MPPRRHIAYQGLAIASCIKANVHISVHDLVDTITLKGLDDECQPSGTATDKLANLKAKQKKAADSMPIAIR